MMTIWVLNIYWVYVGNFVNLFFSGIYHFWPFFLFYSYFSLVLFVFVHWSLLLLRAWKCLLQWVCALNQCIFTFLFLNYKSTLSLTRIIDHTYIHTPLYEKDTKQNQNKPIKTTKSSTGGAMRSEWPYCEKRLLQKKM